MNSKNSGSSKAAKPKAADKPKVGAPTKWRDEFPQLLIDHMRKGLSLEAFAGKIGISVETLNVWANEKPELSEAKKIGTAASRLYWEQQGLKGLRAKTFNAAVWIFNMKNRFGWRDQPLPEAGDDVPEPTLNYQPRKPKE